MWNFLLSLFFVEKRIIFPMAGTKLSFNFFFSIAPTSILIYRLGLCKTRVWNPDSRYHQTINAQQ